MVKFKHGDIFTFKIEDKKYMFGRILLDVKKQCLRKKIIDQSNALSCYGGSILIEIFREISTTKKYSSLEILISGIFVTPFLLEDGEWEILDNIAINPEKIDFQEGLLVSSNEPCFAKGELKIKIPKPLSYIEKINVGVIANACGLIDNIALFYLNSPRNSKEGPLYNSDLRFNDYRKEIYSLVNEDMNQPYYEMAKKHGFDLARFY